MCVTIFLCAVMWKRRAKERERVRKSLQFAKTTTKLCYAFNHINKNETHSHEKRCLPFATIHLNFVQSCRSCCCCRFFVCAHRMVSCHFYFLLPFLSVLWFHVYFHRVFFVAAAAAVAVAAVVVQILYTMRSHCANFFCPTRTVCVHIRTY